MVGRSAENAFLQGSVRKLTLRLALPCLLAMLFSGLSTLFDALFIARLNPSLAAAAGFCFPIVTLIQAIGFTLGMGAGSYVSRELGKGAMSGRAVSAASTAFFLALMLGGLLCLLGQLFPQTLLRLLGAKENALSSTIPYARFVLFCAPLTCTSLVLASLLRAQGKPMPILAAYSLGAAAVTGLSFLLIGRCAMGVFGAGIAMLTREALVLAVFFFYIFREKDCLRPSLRAVSLRLETFQDIMRSGIPTLVRQGLMSISGIMLSRMLAQFGESAVAGMGLALRMVNLITSAIIGFGQGFSPVCAANYGADRMDRVQDAYRFCMRACLSVLPLLGAAVYVAAPFLLDSFAPDETIAAFARLALRAQCVFFFAQGAIILMNMLTQSMGFPVRAILVACGRQGYILIPILLTLPRLLGAWGLILAQPVSDALSLGVSWLLTRSIWKEQDKKDQARS